MIARRLPARGRHNDGGATLVLVLVIVTFVSVVVGVVLTQGETSMRSTIKLRDQASQSYAADAAAQAVITQLQNKRIDCTDPANPTVTDLGTGASSPFYVPVSSEAGPLNARIVCTPDAVDGKQTIPGDGVTIDTSNNPAYALLTVGTSLSVDGQAYRGNQVVCVQGGSVVSNTNINLAGQGSSNSLAVGAVLAGTGCSLRADATIVVSAGSAAGCEGQATDSNPSHFPITPCTHLAAPVPVATWKAYVPVPTDPITVTNPQPLCYSSGGVDYAAYRPGYYNGSTGLSRLNSPSCGSVDIAWFTPGTYYFNTGSSVWNWPATLIGGTPQDASGAVIASLRNFDVTDTSTANKAKLAALSQATKFPGACASPTQQSADKGVEFVFGGASRFRPSFSGKNEICASYDADAPPVAIYGISYDVMKPATSLAVTGGSVPVQTLCSSTPCDSTKTGGNSLIVANDSNGQASFYIEGYTFVPSAPITMIFKNSYGQVFGWGLLARNLDMTVNGTSPSAPFLIIRPSYHDGSPKTTYSIRYLDVYTCVASSSTCTQTGTPDLRVRVQTQADGSLKVLSWSSAN